MKKKTLMVSVILSMVYGCQSNPVIPEATQIVMQAYLYAGQPINAITVMLSRPLSSSDTSNTPVGNAAVTLVKNGAQYQLTPSQQNIGNYFYSGTNLQVQSGDQFEIEVTYNGTTATASTIVPPLPLGLSLNTATVAFTHDTVASRFGGGSFTRLTTSDSVMVSWTNTSQLPFFVTVESIDSTRQPLNADSLGNFNFTRRFVAEPTTDNYYRVPQSDFNYTGNYKITLYRVNQEYVNLYASRQQDSRSLNEPLTNVQNGLGIFTSFASDSAFVNVTLN
jgi:uncharacterized protein YcfL